MFGLGIQEVIVLFLVGMLIVAPVVIVLMVLKANKNKAASEKDEY